jgi:hypothetical protein
MPTCYWRRSSIEPFTVLIESERPPLPTVPLMRRL